MLQNLILNWAWGTCCFFPGNFCCCCFFFFYNIRHLGYDENSSYDLVLDEFKIIIWLGLFLIRRLILIPKFWFYFTFFGKVESKIESFSSLIAMMLIVGSLLARRTMALHHSHRYPCGPTAQWREPEFRANSSRVPFSVSLFSFAAAIYTIYHHYHYTIYQYHLCT